MCVQKNKGWVRELEAHGANLMHLCLSRQYLPTGVSMATTAGQ